MSAKVSPLRFAMFGATHVHAPSYLSFYRSQISEQSGDPNAKIVAVAESDGERVAELRSFFPEGLEWYDSATELLANEQIDGAIICGNNVDHDAFARIAIESSIPVLCEKPLTTTIESSVALVELAKRRGVALLTAFPVRFSAAAESARDILNSGRIGELLSISSTNHGTMPGGWFVDPEQSGGGAILDHTVHVVDALRWILNDEFADVACCTATRRFDLPVEDSGLLLLTTRRGIAVSLDTSWSRPKSYDTWGNVNLRFQGTQGALTVQCFPRQVRTYTDADGGVASSSEVEDMNAKMLQHFEAVVRKQAAPIPTGEDGLRALEVALAAYGAQRAGVSQPVILAGIA